jgi:hypothetical protein
MAESADEAVFDFADERKKWRSEVNTSRKGRKAQLKKQDGTVDRRTLKATGRTEQFNFRTMPEVKERAKKAAALRGLTVTEWIEEAILRLAEEEGKGDE